jgi:hypothetical protein
VKRGTPDHPKARALGARLGLKRYQVAGILETMWAFAAGYAKRGDVGRHSNAALAAAIEWEGDADDLVDALVAEGWLDRCACHRLRIHHWPDHADQTVRRSEEVKKHGFLPCYADDASNTLAPAGTLLANASNTPADASQPTPSPSPLPSPTPVPEPEPAPTPSPARPTRARGDAEAVWRSVLARLRTALPETTWGTWLKPTHGLAFSGDELRVEVPTGQFQTWIAANYREPIARAMAEEGLGAVRLVFEVPPRARTG